MTNPGWRLTRLQDGRNLCYEFFGNQAPSPGRTVLYFHGYLSSRLEAKLLEDEALQLGLRVLAFDRSGYGRSSYDSDRSPEKSAKDVIELLDEVMQPEDRVTVMGVSGGSPYAVAFAALFPDRVQKMLLNVPYFPVAGHEELFEGMSDESKQLIINGRDHPFKIRMTLYVVWVLQRIPHGKMLLRAGGFSTEDLAAADAHPDKISMLSLAGREGTRGGPHGACQDLCIMGSVPLSLDLVKTISCGVEVWAGARDATTPSGMAKLYAETLANANLHLVEDKGHFLGFELGREILSSGLL